MATPFVFAALVGLLVAGPVLAHLIGPLLGRLTKGR